MTRRPGRTSRQPGRRYEAKNARKNAEAEKASVRKAQRLLGLMSASEGMKLAEEGQLALGLLKMAHALVVAPENSDVVAMGRAQFALYCRHSGPVYTLSHLFSHADMVTSVSFSPDGRRFLTGSADSTARVWDADTGKPLTLPLQHAGGVRSVSFSPDGRRVLTGSEDRTARVWDADTGKPLTPAPPWAELRAKYPAEFTVPPQAVRRWREGEIRDCMKEGNVRAAEFHYWALFAELASGKAR